MKESRGSTDNTALPVSDPKLENAMRASSVVALTLLFAGSSAHAAGDAAAGKAAFENQCAACHTTVIGKDGFGPSLAGVVGRKSGTLAGYAYTPAMTHANL